MTIILGLILSIPSVSEEIMEIFFPSVGWCGTMKLVNLEGVLNRAPYLLSFIVSLGPSHKSLPLRILGYFDSHDEEHPVVGSHVSEKLRKGTCWSKGKPAFGAAGLLFRRC
ncbi:hypothetical protein NMG60_11012255 [Bertholletia excelsa]